MTAKNTAVERVRLTDMGDDQARLYLYAARGALRDARNYIRELKTRRGWKALGYPSWYSFTQGELGGHGEEVDQVITDDLPPAA